MSVTVILADGSTDQHADGTEGSFSYWITAAGHLTVYRCPDQHRHGPEEHPEITEAVYSPTGWLKVTGRQRDQEPPTPAPY